ncbi:PKD domain-containing protein [Flavobacterium sp. JP2137]|uniref:PKD domain-containing protein n=1 Tax=Flavobacterium sp. JP2137 TaxID=3414510 RepID=UPI003D300943
MKNFINYRAFSLACVALAVMSSCSSSDDTEEVIPINSSPYVTKVLDYSPAVGQFINMLPKYESGDTREKMIQKAQAAVSGAKGSGVSLGGFGGYIVMGFDHTIANVEGLRDFRVLGNAFWASSNPNASAAERGGSSEPGVIMVAYDRNKNGQPDADEWYEIAGSEHQNPKTIKNYEITYTKPDPNKAATSDPLATWATDIEYIYWSDNQGNSGYKTKNSFHTQSYYPEWNTADQISFKGTLLPNNAADESGNGNYWVQYSFAYGYADNVPNKDDESAIDIAWAVDQAGNRVNLPGVDFIKIYTGTNQESGAVGEISTEVFGIEDLHLLKQSIPTRN